MDEEEDEEEEEVFSLAFVSRASPFDSPCRTLSTVIKEYKVGNYTNRFIINLTISFIILSYILFSYTIFLY